MCESTANQVISIYILIGFKEIASDFHEYTLTLRTLEYDLKHPERFIPNLKDYTHRGREFKFNFFTNWWSDLTGEVFGNFYENDTKFALCPVFKAWPHSRLSLIVIEGELPDFKSSTLEVRLRLNRRFGFGFWGSLVLAIFFTLIPWPSNWVLLIPLFILLNAVFNIERDVKQAEKAFEDLLKLVDK